MESTVTLPVLAPHGKRVKGAHPFLSALFRTCLALVLLVFALWALAAVVVALVTRWLLQAFSKKRQGAGVGRTGRVAGNLFYSADV